MENKTCELCGENFEVTDDDLAFLEKISPELGGKKYIIDSPKLCHNCRQIRRYSWRNERNLYRRKCDLTGEDIISVYSPNKPFKVYGVSAFKSDKWDPMDYGIDFDLNKGFFEQYAEFIKTVPRQANNAVFNENCDYCNQTWHSKDSYMSFNLGYGERCFHANESFYVKDCVDTFDIRNCEYCYSVFDCDNCYNSRFLDHCKDCSESNFSHDCAGCQNVTLCTGLKNKQYYLRNEQLEKEDYLNKVKELNLNTRSGQEAAKQEFISLKELAIHKCDHNLKSEGCSGDYIIESKNCRNCFNIFKSEECYRVANIDDAGRDSRDMNFTAEMELCYEGTSVAGYRNIFCVFIPYGENNYYCNFCENCKNCFACIGLNRKEYCILNKQYSKEEYESLFAKIIEKMKSSGEWGELFPSKMSVFAYNESVANDYHPKSKEEAEKIGAYWQDNDYETEFSGDYYSPHDDIQFYNDNQEEINKLIGGVIKCEKTGKPFKIMPQEFYFYLKNNIPVPTIHFRERYKEIFALRNPRKLYHRQCMNERCNNEFETTYAPDRPEKVYCEECYQKAIM